MQKWNVSGLTPFRLKVAGRPQQSVVMSESFVGVQSKRPRLWGPLGVSVTERDPSTFTGTANQTRTESRSMPLKVVSGGITVSATTTLLEVKLMLRKTIPIRTILVISISFPVDGNL